MERVRGLLRRRRWRVPVVVAMAAAFFFGVCMPLASRAADTVSITVTADYFGSKPSQVVFSRTIKDAQVAGAVQAAVNSLPMASRDDSARFDNGCGMWGSSGYVFRYEFRFSWHGIPLQGATTTSANCPQTDVSTLGIPQLGSRAITATLDWPRMHELTGVPLWQFPSAS